MDDSGTGTGTDTGTGTPLSEQEGAARTVEEALEALEEILRQLEDENTSLEDSFALYGRGMALSKEISGKIDRVEKQMIVLEGGEDE